MSIIPYRVSNGGSNRAVLVALSTKLETGSQRLWLLRAGTVLIPRGLEESIKCWKRANSWKLALCAGMTFCFFVTFIVISYSPYILNHSIRRIHSSVKHSFLYELSLLCEASFPSALCAVLKAPLPHAVLSFP